MFPIDDLTEEFDTHVNNVLYTSSYQLTQEYNWSELKMEFKQTGIEFRVTIQMDAKYEYATLIPYIELYASNVPQIETLSGELEQVVNNIFNTWKTRNLETELIK